jgi:hypothetical protein
LVVAALTAIKVPTAASTVVITLALIVGMAELTAVKVAEDRTAHDGWMLHIDIPTLSEFKALAAVRGDICVSLYMPTSPHPDHDRANRVAFKDLVKEALTQLVETGADKRRLEPLEQQFDHLVGRVEASVQDRDIRKLQHKKPDEWDEFWRHLAHGLGVLATPGSLLTFRLPYAPKPLAEVADRYHLTPLLRAMTSPHDLFVLALSEESVRLIQVVADLPPAPVEVPNLPHSAEQATHRPSIHLRAPRGRLQSLEGEKILLHQYARRVDQALRGVLAGREAPLVLAAAEPIASTFRSVNSYPHLVDEAILQDASHMTESQIADQALPILDRLYARDLKDLIARFDELKPRRATTEVSYAAHAATAGAIDSLLVDFDAVIPGLMSEVDGSVTYATNDDAESYSVVDEVARRALCTGARVLGAKRDELPNRAPLAAILRYQFGVIAG